MGDSQVNIICEGPAAELDLSEKAMLLGAVLEAGPGWRVVVVEDMGRRSLRLFFGDGIKTAVVAWADSLDLSCELRPLATVEGHERGWVLEVRRGD